MSEYNNEKELTEKQKKTEKYLQEILSKNEKRFRQIYENMAVGIARFSLDFKIEAANEACCKMLGYTEDELKGIHLKEITAPETLEKNMKFLKLLRSGKINHYRIEKDFIHKNGKTVYGILDINLIRDDDGKSSHFIGSVLDISNRIKAEKELIKNQDELRSYLNNAPYGIFTLNDKGDYIKVNPATEKMSRYSEAELLKMNFLDIIPKEKHEWVEEKFRKLKEKGKIETDARFIRKDGTKRICHVSAVQLNKKSFIAFTYDISRKISEEMEKEHLQAQLSQAQKMESIGRLAGGIAHDFNNMLTVILGYSQMIISNNSHRPEICKDLNEVLTAGERSKEITKKLLAFARKETISPKTLNLNKVFDEIYKMLQRLIGENIKFRLNKTKNLWHVKFDPRQIDQIMINLCINAKDAIDSNGEIIINLENIIVDETKKTKKLLIPKGKYVLISVSDTGCGMDEYTKENLFEPFFTTKETYKGTGLGLSTVYGIIKQNNAYIDFKSETGNGTVFNIYIPTSEDNTDKIIRMSEKEVPQANEGETILLVEDEEAILNLVESMLINLGYKVFSANNSLDGLSIAEDESENINILMTDLIMPDMNGDELSEKIYDINPNIKALFMSGYATDVFTDDGIVYEEAHFLNKPFSLNECALKIRSILDEK